MICYICRENVFLPVEITCFKCYKKNDIHCNSYIRICLECSVKYLEISKNRYDRKDIVKCLLCPETVNPKNLKKDESIRTDFIRLKENENIYKCSFCNNFEGTSLEIYKHLEECPFYFRQCCCGTIVQYQINYKYHLYFCSKHKHCQECDEFIHIDSFSVHMHEKHQKHWCKFCFNYFVDLDEHIDKCDERYINCFFCYESMQYFKYEQHLIEHENEDINKIKKLQEMIKELDRQLQNKRNYRLNRFNNYLLTL